jgi:hypothetical protein
VTNEELIAEAQHTVLVLRRLAKSEAHAASAAFYEDVALVLEGLAVALEAQSAPLVADSVEAMARQMYRIREGVRFINSHDSTRSPEVDRAESDKAYWSWDNGKAGRALYDTYRDLARDLLASGVVSLAADRDRATAERAWDKGSRETERFYISTQGYPVPHNPYRESEARND